MKEYLGNGIWKLTRPTDFDIADIIEPIRLKHHDGHDQDLDDLLGLENDFMEEDQ